MIPKQPVKPLELVVSAIQSLNEKKSWSVQKIVKYIGGKYDVDLERLRPFVCEGIRRGLATRILSHRSGLFRLNHIVIESLGKRINENREKLRRLKAQARRRKLKNGKKVCHHNCQLHKTIKKIEVNRRHKKNVQKQIRKLQEELKQHKKAESKFENGNKV